MEQIIYLSGLTCEACAKLAHKRIEKLDGIKSVIVDPDGKTIIEAERIITKKEIQDSITDLGYGVK